MSSHTADRLPDDFKENGDAPEPMVHVEALLNVAYDANGMTPQQLKEALQQRIEWAIGNGLLSGHLPSEVDEWEVSLEAMTASEANLQEEDVDAWLTEQISDGHMRMEGIPERMARYAMESPAQMRLEFGERMGLEDTEHNRVHVEALLNVTYVPNGMSEDELESFLAEGIERAIGNGLLSGDSPAEVDEYEVAFRGRLRKRKIKHAKA